MGYKGLLFGSIRPLGEHLKFIGNVGFEGLSFRVPHPCDVQGCGFSYSPFAVPAKRIRSVLSLVRMAGRKTRTFTKTVKSAAPTFRRGELL
jgi:hypothetical protein